MTRAHRQLLLCWAGLLLLAAAEFGCATVRFDRSYRPLLLLPALAMVALMALMFMRVRSGVAVVRVFAIAGLFWLTILLGLGMMDPLTRAIYPVVAG
jgi:cytochrome c oxidase subunit 4